MNGVNPKDLILICPELILTGAALVLIILSRRIEKSSVVTTITVLAAIGAGVASIYLAPDIAKTGFGKLIILDGYSLFFKVLIVSTLALITLLSAGLFQSKLVPPTEYCALLLLATTGMMFAVSALDLLTLYLCLELMTICSYILVGITVDKPLSNEAAIKYFLLGSFASAVFLYVIALLYGVTGTTNFEAIVSVINGGVGNSNILLLAIVLLTSGLAFKISAFPFHAWAPDAYQGAKTPVAAFLATASKAAGMAALGRVCLMALNFEGTNSLSHILTILAALSILVGTLVALTQTNMKRLLAYSSISHVGHALLGLVAATYEAKNSGAVSATMTYIFFYVLMTIGAFGVVIALGPRGEKLEGFRGLATYQPKTAALMLLFLLSLTGIPPTAGFTAKFSVILSIINTGHYALAVFAVLFSVVSAFVYLRIAIFMYMKEPVESATSRFPFAVSAALAIAGTVTIIGGILPGILAPWTAVP